MILARVNGQCVAATIPATAKRPARTMALSQTTRGRRDLGWGGATVAAITEVTEWTALGGPNESSAGGSEERRAPGCVAISAAGVYWILFLRWPVRFLIFFL